MTQEDIANIVYNNLNNTSILKEIYKLYLKEKFEIISHFRTTLISEGCSDLADEYFEDVENLEQELKTLEE